MTVSMPPRSTIGEAAGWQAQAPRPGAIGARCASSRRCDLAALVRRLGAPTLGGLGFSSGNDTLNPTSLRAPAAPAAFLTLPALTLLVLTSFAATPALAQREDKGLQMNCAGDYFKLCAGADPDSPEVERCFARNRARLSPQCRAAITAYDRKSGSKDSDD